MINKRIYRRATSMMAALTIAMTVATVMAGNRPNIILLMGDDHGWDETGYNGHPHLQTPVLDDMAARGLRLDRFYSAHPSCSPTRGSVITGRHPNRYGTFTPNYSIRPEEISIGQVLSHAGYACGHFGKWHLGPVKAASPTNPGAFGFKQWLSHDNFFELNPVLSRNGGPPTRFPGESSEIIVRETIRFLKTTQRQKKPFLAVVWFGSPHEPYSGLPKDLALYDNLPAEYADKQFKLTSNETGRPTKRPLRDVLRERYAEITAMDRSIGQLRQWLKQEKLQDNTLLWYCGDNGTPGDGIVTSPFRGQKGTMYEGGVRVPGIIEWPSRISTARVSSVNSVTSDTLPTLCDLLDLPLPSRPLDGISLEPLIAGQMKQRPSPICFWSFDVKRESRQPVYIEAGLQQGTTPLVKMMGDLYTRNFRNYHHKQITPADFAGSRVILDNRYKLVVNGQGRDASNRELFDVRKDPGEKNNLLQAHPQVADALQQQLVSWQQSVLKSLTGADYR
ncbi:MAG: sulfatase-like hydrolase/transferase [Pirellulaceae bacterium]